MRSRRIAWTAALGLTGALTALSVAGATTPTTLHGLTGAQVDALALAQMRAAGSYTVVITSVTSHLDATSTTSSTLTSGVRHDVINGQPGERVFVGGVAYVRFSTALEKIYFGKVIAPLTGHWVAFHPGQHYFGIFAATMTEATLAPLLKLTGNVTASPPLSFGGQTVVGVTNATSSSSLVETLYVANTAPHLPVGVIIASRAGGVLKPLETFVFKNWGAHVAISAPAHALPSSNFALP